MSGITDEFLNITHKVVTLPTSVVETEVNKFHKNLLARHTDTAKELIDDEKILNDVTAQIIDLAERLRITLIGVGYLEDITEKSQDYIVSFGERMSSILVSGALSSSGVRSVPLTGYDAGLITDSNFGSAKPIHSISAKNVNNRLSGYLKEGITPVVTGFIAADKNARITTLGRGGSDYTASLIGKYLGAQEVQIWTDVDGIMTTDPRITPDARVVSRISYVEAIDLAYFGAKVIHSRMVEPAMDAQIPIIVKNTFNPDAAGTIIVHEQKEIEGIIKAVAISRGNVILNFTGAGMAETPNLAGKILSALGEDGINIIMISGASESNLSIVISKNDESRVLESLEKIEFINGIRNFDIINNTAIISVVGAGMRGARGIASAIFETVAQEDVNVIMIAQGSSEVNVSFVINEVDGDRVIRALHRRFVEKI